MLSAAICLLVQPRLISVEIPALPAPKAVAEIARISGDALYAAPEVEIDIVCIRAKNVEISELKRQLAATIGAVWETRNGKETLARPISLARAQEQAEYDAKSREISTLISARPKLTKFGNPEAAALVAQSIRAAEPLAEMLPYEEHDKLRRQLWALRDQEPISRMLDRILPYLDPQEIARIKPGQPIVFSDRPTRMQRPLDGKAVDAARDGFRNEQRLFRGAIQRSGVQRYGRGDDTRLLTWESDPDFHKMVLKVDIVRQTGLPRFTLRIADEQGNVRAAYVSALRRQPKIAGPARQWDGSIELGEVARSWNRLFYQMITIDERDGETKKPISELIAPLLDEHSNPERFEPLSYAAGCAFLSFANNQDRNIVACIPDQALVWSDGLEATYPAQTFALTAGTKWQGQFELDGDWIRYRPQYLSEGRRNRLNRSALGKFFRAARTAGAIRIEDAAQYAYATASPLLFESWDRTAAGYSERFQGEYSSSDLSNWYYRAPLKFIGSLSPRQRQSLFEGRSIPVNQLSEAARIALHRFTYGETFVTRGIFANWVSGEEDSQKIRGSLSEDATEALGNGIPADTLITGASKQVPMLVYRLIGGPVVFSTAGSPSSVGKYVAADGGSSPPSSEFLLGTALQFSLDIKYGIGLSSKTEMYELMKARRERYKTWSDLPPEIRAPFENGLKQERERQNRERNRSRTTPPPAN